MSEDVQAEIARLTGAIAAHKATVAATGHPPIYPPRGSSWSARGASRGARGGRGRAPATATHRNATWVAPGRTTPTTSAGASASNSTTPTTIATPSSSRPPVPVGGYRNKTLVLNPPGLTTSTSNSTTPSASTLTSRAATPTQATTSKASITTSTPSIASRPHAPGTEVVIDGVTFVAAPRGNKLVRKSSAPASATGSGSTSSLPHSAVPTTSASSSAATQSSTPRRASISGTTYIRTKNGNLISLDVARKRKELNERKKNAAKKERLDRLVGIVNGVQSARNPGKKSSTTTRSKSMKPCRFFQKTGQCKNALRCRYIHDSHRVSICPSYLRHKCPLPSTSCLLSHESNAHRSPHCIHHPHCTKRDECRYAHIDGIDKDANICRPFVEYGWCEQGEACKERHANECPRFAETGQCTKKGCKLPHVLRRRNEEVVEGGGIDWNAGPEWDVKKEGEGEEFAQEVLERARKKRRVAMRGHELEQNQDFVTLEVEISDDEQEVEGEEEGEGTEEDVSSGEEDDEEEVEEEQLEDSEEEEERVDSVPSR